MLADASLTNASDGLAVVMLLLVGFSLGMILTILIVMARNSGRKPEVLPEEDEEAQKPPTKQPGEVDPSPVWERDGDWWKDKDGNP